MGPKQEAYIYIFFLTAQMSDSELTAAALSKENTFSLNVGKKLFNINPII